MNKFFVTVSAVGLLAQAHAIPQKATVDRIDTATKAKIDKLVAALMTSENTPGLELAIQRKGEVVYECGYGQTKLAGGGIPGPDTHFQIDSLTKVFTAMDILL